MLQGYLFFLFGRRRRGFCNQEFVHFLQGGIRQLIGIALNKFIPLSAVDTGPHSNGLGGEGKGKKKELLTVRSMLPPKVLKEPLTQRRAAFLTKHSYGRKAKR